MADQMITPIFRSAFCALFRAVKPKNAAPDKAPEFSIRACFPPETDLSAFKTAAAEVARAKWGDKLDDKKFAEKLNSPFRTNDELDNPIQGIGDDWVIMTFSAKEKDRPGIVDRRKGPDGLPVIITDEEDVYSGAWFRAQVRPYAWENSGKRGVSFGLQNVQKLRDDEPLGAGRMPANKAFEAVPDEDAPATGAKTAGALF